MVCKVCIYSQWIFCCMEPEFGVKIHPRCLHTQQRPQWRTLSQSVLHTHTQSSNYKPHDGNVELLTTRQSTKHPPHCQHPVYTTNTFYKQIRIIICFNCENPMNCLFYMKSHATFHVAKHSLWTTHYIFFNLNSGKLTATDSQIAKRIILVFSKALIINVLLCNQNSAFMQDGLG